MKRNQLPAIHFPPDRPAIQRAVDASANRATEAVRIAEDIARFVLNDNYLTQSCKDLRHDLTAVVELLSLPEVRIRARDTGGDVGTAISSGDEYSRATMLDLAQSNFKRAQQAVRSLEEFAKLLDQEIAARLEGIRYRLYSLEIPFVSIASSRARLSACDLCVLMDGRSSPDDFRQFVERLADADTPMIQLRDKSLSDRELLDRALVLVRIARSRGMISIINDRADIAAASGADGVHLGQTDLPISAARRLVAAGCLVGASVHSVDQARQAVLAGADYLGVGPVFASLTKRFHQIPGLPLLQSVTTEVGLPCFAIGGITADNLASVLATGATRVAVGNAILTAKAPEDMIAILRQHLAVPAVSTETSHA